MSQHQKNNALMTQLKAHFNLDTELFSEKSDFFFEGAQRQHNLETLRHLACFGDMVLFLTGEKGAGKTHTLRQLLKSSFEGLNIIYLDCGRLAQDGQGRSSNALEVCARELGIEVKAMDASTLFSSLLSECRRRHSADGVRVLLALDNADKLSKKELQEYCSFCKTLPPESPLVILFAGPSSLIKSSRLGGDLERDAWWHQIQLKPLSHNDVLPYLEQALSNAGYSERLELTDTQIRQLTDLGKGLPGRINKIYPSVVLEPGLLKIKPKSKVRGAPVGILLGLAGLLILSFIFVSYQHGLFDRVMPVFSLEDRSSKTSEDEGVPNAESLLVSNESDEAALQKQQARIAMLDSVLKDKGISMPADIQEESSVPLFKPGSDLAIEKQVNSEEASIEDFHKREIAVPKENDAEVSKLTLNDVTATTQSHLDNQKALDVKQPEAPKQEPLKPVAKKTLYLKSQAWLQGQSSSSYMAQILGSYSEETAINFIKKVGKQKSDVFYLINEHKGKPWYVVFYGIYPAKAHAQDAVKNAPKIIRSQNPWIRSSSDVLASYPK